MDKKIQKQNVYIFNKYVNGKSRPIVFDTNLSYAGEIKYLPPVSKEWKNNICLFNINNLKNLPSYDLSINSLIKGYFNLYFNYKFLLKKFSRRKYIRLSINKVFISKAEIKHTNSKALITIYTYNREKKVLLKKIRKLKKLFFNTIIKMFKFRDILNLKKLNEKIYKDSNVLVNYLKKRNLLNNSFLTKNTSRQLFLLKKKWKKNSFIFKKLRKNLVLLRRFKLRFDLNKFKFEEIFLLKLSELISKFYNKKVEFNIVNLKSIVFNTDLFTKILSLKMKRNRPKIMKLMRFALNKAKLPKLNKIIEKSTPTKTVMFDLIENKYKNLHLQSVLNQQDNIDNKLNEIYPSVISNNNYNKISEILFNSVKYKNMGGIRLEVKGRLTKRYRADRAIFKVLWKGGLKNIDSSYKRLSSVIMRGSIKSNVEYSIVSSKRRIGAFAVKGWISGK